MEQEPGCGQLPRVSMMVKSTKKLPNTLVFLPVPVTRSIAQRSFVQMVYIAMLVVKY